MAKYKIENRVSGLVLGVYEADSEQGALEAMAQDAGYESYEKCRETAEGKQSLDVIELS